MRRHARHSGSAFLLVGGGLLLLLATVAILAPVLSPHDPRALSGDSLERPSGRHLLGTNDVGQDIFSELVWGARTSLVVAVSAPALAIAVGLLVGVSAGLLGGVADTVLMRIVDVFLAIPGLPLLILISTLVGPSLGTVVVVIALMAWPEMARVVRGPTLALRQRGFVVASHALGAGLLHVMRRHLVPALAPLVAALFVYWAGTAVLLESGLAFLGLGDPLSVSWGEVLNRALLHEGLYFSPLWTWWVLPAGLAITVSVLGFTLLGIGLEPRFNPGWRQAL